MKSLSQAISDLEAPQKILPTLSKIQSAVTDCFGEDGDNFICSGTFFDG